jgi:hypothetical protein
MGTTETVPWDEIINLDCLETLRFCVSMGAAFKTRKTQYPKSFGINKVLNQPLKHEHISTLRQAQGRLLAHQHPSAGLGPTFTHLHIRTSAHQHISTSAPFDKLRAGYQHISTSAH